MREYAGDAATRTQQKYISDFDDASGRNSFKLTLNRYDREFFRQEVQEPQVVSVPPPEPELASHRLIRKAREFFKGRFAQSYESRGRGKAAFDWALRIRRVLTDHVSIVAVTSADEDNAASVFETLNDRGIGLSTPDLLRNLVLRRAQDDTRDEIIECWRSILELEEDAKVETFLRHYWLSRNGDVKTRSLYREIKKNVTQANVDSLTFSRELEREARVYREIAAARDEDRDLQRSLDSVSMLGAQSLIPAILSAYAVGSLEDKRKFLCALITLFVRHNLVGGLENSRLETAVFNVAKQLRQDSDFPNAIRILKELAPSDIQFTERMRTAQVTRRDSARYLLRELERAKRATQELEVEAPDRVHVEHIYPQTPEPGQRWENHNMVVNRLGNLTLLSRRLNQEIRNADFAAKKPSYEQSDLLLTKEVAAFPAWDVDAVNQRQDALSQLAVEIWKFPE
jgi:hypothetical protein